MKKYLIYIISSIICAAALAVIFSGYFLYEYKANMAYGIGAPIGVAACIVCLLAAELVCVRMNKNAVAIVLAIIKYILFVIGLFFVFRHTVIGVGVMLLFGVAIPFLLPVAIAAAGMRIWIFLVCAVLFYAGVLSETIMVAFVRKLEKKLSDDSSIQS